MAKKILLIENDPDFSSGLTRSLEDRGLDVRVTGDGRVGLELAREWAPDAVVLCVELPGMSGYLVCQKLRKEEGLRSIPLVLTSAEATEETFEKHRTLKARADEYLLKPYAPDALLAILDALVGLPVQEDGEEIVSLEEEVALEPSAPDQAALSALELESLPDEPAAAIDEDLALLDHAFDEIALPAPEQAGDALDLALAGAGDALDPEPSAAEQELAIAPEPRVPGPELTPDPEPAAAALELLDPEPASAGVALEVDAAAEAERSELRERLAEAESRIEEAQAEVRRARAEAAAATARMPELERQLEALRAELLAARGEAEAARGEAERRGADLRRRVSELEAAGAKNEERILKAYQRLKADERVKEKVRKALAIAMQLLDEGVPADGASPERRGAA